MQKSFGKEDYRNRAAWNDKIDSTMIVEHPVLIGAMGCRLHNTWIRCDRSFPAQPPLFRDMIYWSGMRINRACWILQSTCSQLPRMGKESKIWPARRPKMLNL